MKRLLVLTLIASISLKTNAQNDIGQFLQAGRDDGAKLIGAYIGPLFKGFGAGLNNGWYTTAKPHKSGRFDLTFSLNPVFVPASDQTFNVNDLGLQTFKVLKGDPNSPTVSGPDRTGATVGYTYNNPITTQTDTVQFKLPNGTNAPYAFAPTLQLGIGIYKGTEVMLRYIPTSNFGSAGTIGLYGFGVKHDFKQWIPAISALPFDLSAMFGHTSFSYSVPLNALAPEAGVKQENGNPAPDYSTQGFSVKTKATTFGVIISKKITVLTVYAGTGMNLSSTKLAMDGIYPVTTFNTNTTPNSNPGAPKPGEKQITNIAGPSVDISGPNSPYITAGLRLKFFFLTLGGNYTVSKYSGGAVNLGLCVDFL